MKGVLLNHLKAHCLHIHTHRLAHSVRISLSLPHREHAHVWPLNAQWQLM